MYRVAIVCLSDKGYRGEREDKSTGVIEEILLENKFEVSKKVLIPDEYHVIVDELRKICDNKELVLFLNENKEKSQLLMSCFHKNLSFGKPLEYL